jgi:hypothetical protein
VLRTVFRCLTEDCRVVFFASADGDPQCPACLMVGQALPPVALS